MHEYVRGGGGECERGRCVHEYVRGGGGECERGRWEGVWGGQDNDDYEKIKIKR